MHLLEPRSEEKEVWIVKANFAPRGPATYAPPPLPTGMKRNNKLAPLTPQQRRGSQRQSRSSQRMPNNLEQLVSRYPASDIDTAKQCALVLGEIINKVAGPEPPSA